MKNLSTTKKVILFIVLNAIVWGTAIFFYMEAEKQKREAAVMQDLQLRLLGIDPDAKATPQKIKVFMTTGDCNSDPALNGEFWNGHTAAAYCEANGEGDWHPRLEGVCFTEGLTDVDHAINGYGNDYKPTKEEFVELACGIANSYPQTNTDNDWETPDLGDALEVLIADHLSTY